MKLIHTQSVSIWEVERYIPIMLNYMSGWGREVKIVKDGDFLEVSVYEKDYSNDNQIISGPGKL